LAVNAATTGRYGGLSAVLSPAAVSQHLAAHGWQLERRQDKVRELWSLTDDAGDTIGRVLLPLATDFEDFRHRYDEALYGIAQVYGWDPETLFDRISATRADIFSIRLDQSLPDGTIPFAQADDTLRGIHKMLKAAATSAATPRHSQQGQPSSMVREFLTDDVRLGHTKRGSFIFTVVTRLKELEIADSPADESSRRPAPFPRRVMEVLAHSLAETRSAAMSPQLADDEDARAALSLKVVESLEDITKAPGLRALDLAFDWSVALPSSTAVARIRMDRDVIGNLARMREQLARREDPPTHTTVVGPVKSLTREGSEPDAEQGTVVVVADIAGKGIRNVHVGLAGANYDWVIQAHRAKLPIMVTGDLTYTNRKWRPLGDITMDVSFLKHIFQSPNRPET
jgi:hypothetical protein